MKTEIKVDYMELTETVIAFSVLIELAKDKGIIIESFNEKIEYIKNLRDEAKEKYYKNQG